MVIKDNDYIYGISKPYGEEEKEIHEICKNAPIAPDGYIYKLTVNKTWELCEKPISVEMAFVEQIKSEVKKEIGKDE